MKVYERRTPRVEAVQWDGTVEGGDAILELLESRGYLVSFEITTRYERGTEGPSTQLTFDLRGKLSPMRPGDWVFFDEDGAINIEHDDVFNALYKEANKVAEQ